VQIASLLAAALVLGGLFVLRERRAADPLVPLEMLRARAVAIASVALFLTTASLFAVTVFVPLFLQATTGASPTSSGLLLVPMMLGITTSTMLAGRAIARTGRYKRYPVAGLAIMSVTLALLAVVAGHPSQALTALVIAIFGLGFGMVSQVLVVAVQNGVEQQRIGVATAATNFFRGLGGALGAAALGAVQAVFAAAAPLAFAALVVVLRLPETPLRTQVGAASGEADPPASPTNRQAFVDGPRATGRLRGWALDRSGR
jgi:predicted MFS family arabinose efflux permease